MTIRPTINQQRTPEDIISLQRAGTLDVASITFTEELALRRWARSAERRSRGTIERLLARGQTRRARREVSRHMCKLGVRMIALMTAARRRHRLAREADVPTREIIRQRRLADMFAALSTVTSFTSPAGGFRSMKRKRDGGTRPIISFYWEDDARFRVIRSALQPFALASFHHAQFMHPLNGVRRGPASVREAMLQALRETGDGYVFLQFDIRDFFGSISHEWLERALPLDQGIVKRFVHLGEMLIVPTGEMRVDRPTDDASSRTDRRGIGIPQGSALSALIAEWVMADILRSDAVFDRVRLFSWSDNLGVLVPQGEESVVVELIQAAFARHGAGPFRLNLVNRTSVTCDFKFLGTWYQVVAGEPRAFVPQAVVDGWVRSVTADILTASTDDLDNMRRRVMAKLNEWRWWPGAEPLTASVLADINRARNAPQSFPFRSGVDPSCSRLRVAGWNAPV